MAKRSFRKNKTGTDKRHKPIKIIKDNTEKI